MDSPRTPVRYAMDLTDLSQLDPVAAHLCGWVSYYAYYDSASDLFFDGLGAVGVRRIAPDEATGRPQGWIVELPECFVVAFAGTTDYGQLYGLLRDTFYAILWNTPAGQLAGSRWAKMARDAWTTDHVRLLECMHAKKTIFTGHSLGGAITACLLQDLKAGDSPGAQPSTCITFGSPRIGNAALSAATVPWPNIVIPGDPVPKLPPLGYARPLLSGGDSFLRPVWPGYGFQKHGNLYYLHSDGVLEFVDRGAKADPSDIGVEYDATRAFLDVGAGGLLGSNYLSPVRFFQESLPKHYMAEYLRRLEKNIPNVPAAHDSLNDLGFKYEVEVLPNPPDPVLSTIVPPVYPTPAASTGVTPLRRRKKH